MLEKRPIISIQLLLHKTVINRPFLQPEEGRGNVAET